MSSPLLEVENLTLEYNGNLALSLDHFSMNQGQLVGVVGANGAGKSSFVGALMGWSRGDPVIRGRVRFEGRDISAMPTRERARAGLLLIPENQLVFSRMTVEENLAHGYEGSEPGRHAYSAEEIYTLFPNLAERRRHLGGQLSGGERQMLGIGRALRLAPKILILDEPSIGLAPKFVSVVLETVRNLADRGLTVLLVEQNVKAAIKVVNRLVLMERGRIVAAGDPGEMATDPRVTEAYLGALT